MVSVNLTLENRKRFEETLRKASNVGTKLKPSFFDVVKQLRSDIYKNFTFSQPGYAKLTEPYLSQKIKKYGVQPILVAAGRLRIEATQKGAKNHIEKITNKEIVFGTKNPYAIPLQNGTKHMKKRPFYFLTNSMTSKYFKIIKDSIEIQYTKLGLKNG